MASVTYLQTSKLIELLNTADPKKTMYVRVLSSTRLSIGPDPMKPSAAIDLVKEKIVPFAEEALKDLAPGPQSEGKGLPNPDETQAWRTSRRSGEYWFELNGKRQEFHSLRDLLAGGLNALEKERPGTLEILSHIKPRSRRIVARDPKELFDKDHLAKDYAEKLMDGWYYGTNNSAAETDNWLERATTCAGLKWGEEFKTSINSVDKLLELVK
jgi:hypothetical protein